MHPNLLAYNDYEIFESEQELQEYRESKIKGVGNNVKFIEREFGDNLRVIEIGSGNSKFLYALDQESLLKFGYGIEVSSSRIKFANDWKKALGNQNVYNYEDNILNVNFDYFGQTNLVYCVDLAFQFIDPLKPGSDKELLKKIYNHLEPDGRLVLELDTHKRLIDQMENNSLKTWQEFSEPDPWKYLLWDCSLEEQNIIINKTFIKRDFTETSDSKVVLKNYDRHDIISMMQKIGFKNCKVYEHWHEESDLLEDEFIVVGEKYA